MRVRILKDGVTIARANDRDKPVKVEFTVPRNEVPEELRDLLKKRKLPLVSGGQGQVGDDLVTIVDDKKKGTADWLKALLDRLRPIGLDWERI